MLRFMSTSMTPSPDRRDRRRRAASPTFDRLEGREAPSVALWAPTPPAPSGPGAAVTTSTTSNSGTALTRGLIVTITPTNQRAPQLPPRQPAPRVVVSTPGGAVLRVS